MDSRSRGAWSSKRSYLLHLVAERADLQAAPAAHSQPAPGRLVEFGHVLVPVAALDRERRVVRLPPLGDPLVGFEGVLGPVDVSRAVSLGAERPELPPLELLVLEDRVRGQHLV